MLSLDGLLRVPKLDCEKNSNGTEMQTSLKITLIQQLIGITQMLTQIYM